MDKPLIRQAVTFPQLLTAIFIGLRLSDHIAWSWAFVLAPLWIEFLLVWLFTFLRDLADQRKGRK